MMLPLKQYTIEDFYKFYRIVSPMIDKMLSEDEGFKRNQFVRFEAYHLRDALSHDFKEEVSLTPIAFRQFVDRMMEEMECPRVRPCEERTSVYWYSVTPYLSMRRLNPGVHDRIFEGVEQNTYTHSEDNANSGDMYIFPSWSGRR